MSKYKLGLAGIIRDRSNYVKEWLAFHHLAGVEAFYIVLDGCKEPTKERILELPFQENIFLHETTHTGNDYRQVAAYEFIFNRYKNDCDWMVVVDSDEFLFNPQGRDLKEVLTEFDSIDCGGVIVPWTVFGPSNHVVQPPGLFIDNFVTSHGVRNRTWGTVKSITKTSEYESCGHVHYMNVRKPYVLEDGKPFELVGPGIPRPARRSKCRKNASSFSSPARKWKKKSPSWSGRKRSKRGTDVGHIGSAISELQWTFRFIDNQP